jgi:hypothetical protein
MKLRASIARDHDNLDVIRRVLNEFDGEIVVELSRKLSCAFLMWRSTTDGENRSLSVAIPGSWLNDPRRASSLEETTRNFAGRIVKAMY